MQKVMELKPINIVGDENIRLVAGWASVEVVDRQGQLVPVDELEKALIRYSLRGAPLNYGHKNHQVGKVLNWYTVKHPDTGKWGVYIIASIFSGEPIYDIVWDAVKEGKLNSFSIAGLAGETERTIVHENGIAKSVEILKNITITEISIVEKPANQLAVIEIVNTFAKGDIDVNILETSFAKGIIDETYEILEKEFGKNVADKAIDIFVDMFGKFANNVIYFSKNDDGIMAKFKDEYEAMKYALSHNGFIVPLENGEFAVVSFKYIPDKKETKNVDVTNDQEGLEGLEELGELGVKKEDGAVSSDVGVAYENPTYGGVIVPKKTDKSVEEDDNNKDEKNEEKVENVKENINDVLELFKKGDLDVAVLNMLRESLQDELDAVMKYESFAEVLRELGFDSLAEKIMSVVAEEKRHIGEFLEMIREVSPEDMELIREGRDEVEEEVGGEDVEEDVVTEPEEETIVPEEVEIVELGKGIKSKEEFRRILVGILNEAKKIKGFVENHAESGAYKGMAEDIVKTIEALLNELDNGVIDINKSDSSESVEEVEKAEKKRGEHKKCMERYYNYEENHFKGREGTGERFKNCVKAQMHCNGKSKEEAEEICGKIARSKGYPKKGEAPDIEKLKETQKKLDELRKAVLIAKKKKKSGCRKRYYNEAKDEFKVMTCPDDPSEKSKFCACVRYEMECNGKSLEDAKNICGYIKYHVKKEFIDSVTKAKIALARAILKEEKRGRPKDKCRAKYTTRDGKYKKMSDPQHPKKPISEFWGCVRYYMNCKKKKYEDAKNMCGKARYEAMAGGGERVKATVTGRS